MEMSTITPHERPKTRPLELVPPKEPLGVIQGLGYRVTPIVRACGLWFSRGWDRAEPGTVWTVSHSEPVGGVGQLTMRVGERPRESNAW